MTENWLADDLTEIKKLYEECLTRRETALMSYLIGVEKMLNDLANMKEDRLYVYNKKILWHPIKIFTKYFIKQVKAALYENDLVKKKKIIVDIEDALTRVMEVYKNAIDSTATANSQRFTGFAVDTSIYDLSSKLTAFYSDILQSVAEMFDPKGENYAFLLYPNLRHNTEAYHLFKEWTGHGRVTIIYIPESKIKSIDTIPIFLLHEAFHVLTREERNRRLRSGEMLVLMEETLDQLLYENTKLTRVQRNLLMNKWFSQLADVIKNYRTYDKDDESFYGKNLIIAHDKLFKDQILAMDQRVEKDIMQMYCDLLSQNDNSTYEEYINAYRDANRSSVQILNNAKKILAGQSIKNYLEQFLSLFREIYADIAFLLLIPLTPQQYENAFLESIPFESGNHVDFERYIRMSIVSKILASFSEKESYDAWKAYYETKKGKMRKISNISLQNLEDYINIIYTDAIEAVFLEYFNTCARQMKERIAGLPGLGRFRKKINSVLTLPPQVTLWEMFSGDL